MGILNAFFELVAAEAPAEEPKEDFAAEAAAKDDDGPADEEAEAEGAEDKDAEDEDKEDKEDEDEEDKEYEENEDEEDKIVDPKVTLEEECKQSKQCAPAKHHFDDCVDRVQQQKSEGEAKEDCVEEFFHLAHCATACAAPKLWSKLN